MEKPHATFGANLYKAKRSPYIKYRFISPQKEPPRQRIN